VLRPPVARLGLLLRAALLLAVGAALVVPALHASAATAPRNLTLPKVTGTASVTKMLTATPGTWSASPAPTYAYAWQRCTAGTTACTVISGATKATYTVVLADKGKQLRVKVTATNSAGSKIAYSANTATANQLVQSIAPVNTSPPTITGTPVDTATLTATSGTWSGTPVPTYTYQWQRCLAGTCAATGAAGSQYLLGPSDVGATITVLVTATNTAGSATKQATPTATVAAQPATNTAPPAVVGVPTAGTELASSPGTWNGTAPLSFAYQWQRCGPTGASCTTIPGATASTYLPVPGDIGSTLRFTLSAANAAGVSPTVTSPVSAVVVAGASPPAPLALPSIDVSTPSDGDTLTAVAGQWDSTTAVSRQWQACDSDGLNCQDLPGATGATYAVQSSNLGSTLVVREVATNKDGNTLAFSAPTAVVAPRAPANAATDVPRVVGRALTGATVTAAPGTWTGSPTITFAYQWESSADNQTWVPIDGATGQTYVLAPTDANQFVHVVVTAANGAATTAQAVSPSVGRVVTSGVLWGMSDSWADNGVYFDATEQALGRRMALVRKYYRIDQDFVDARVQQLAATGHSPVVSVRSMTTAGVPVSYADVTAGLYDAYLTDGLGRLNALGVPAYFIFQHEADGTTAKSSCSTTDDATCGQQFIAAWRHVRGLAIAAGDTNVHFVWTVTAYGFSTATKARNNYYWPGAADVDWVGVDVYTGACSGGYSTFAQMLAPSIAWIQANAAGVPVMIPEWGTTEGLTPDAKANFFAGVPAALAQPGYDQIQGLVYWNQASSSSCNFKVDSSPQSFNAFAALGMSPSFAQLPLLPPVTPPPDPTPDPTTAPDPDPASITG
jgi:hypothetical protein